VQARQDVLTPLFRHLTLERLHLEQAMDDRILGWSTRRCGPASLGFLSCVAAARSSSTPLSTGWVEGSVVAVVWIGRESLPVNDGWVWVCACSEVDGPAGHEFKREAIGAEEDILAVLIGQLGAGEARLFCW
jgi:hypothetical protein